MKRFIFLYILHLVYFLSYDMILHSLERKYSKIKQGKMKEKF